MAIYKKYAEVAELRQLNCWSSSGHSGEQLLCWLLTWC